MRTATASVTWTTVLEYTTNVGFVTVLARSECGCADIPEEDCDCDGNQPDALGVCGGDCSDDADADGICDDVDLVLALTTSVASVTVLELFTIVGVLISQRETVTVVGTS